MPSTRRFKKSFYLIVFLNCEFVLLGAITTLLGVILPYLSARLNLKDSESGLFFTVQFGAAIIATFFSNRLCERFGFISTLISGLVFLAAAIAGFNRFDWNGVVICAAFLGFGIGLTIPTTNLLLTKISGDKTASALNLLNFCYGLGALICPSFVGLVGNNSIDLPLIYLSFISIVGAFALLLFALTGEGFELKTSAQPSEKKVGFWLHRYFYLTLLLFLLVVGIESGVTAWLPTYSLRLQNAGDGFFMPMATIFWAAFMCGRIIAPLCLSYLSNNNFLLCCLLVAVLGGFLFVLSVNINLTAFGIGLTGLGISPIFPTALAQFVKIFGSGANSGAVWLFLGGSVGGGSVTWLIGFLSSVTGSLQNGLLIVPTIILMMIWLQVLNTLDAKKFALPD